MNNTKDLCKTEEVTPIDIKSLKSEGISENDIKKLQSSGYLTVESIAFSSKRSLMAIKGISEAKAERLLKASLSILPKDFQSLIPPVVQNNSKIPIGLNQLDDLLQGGIETGTITDVYGETRTGKTQLCHQLCVACQANQEGQHAWVLYIDTEGSFDPERILSLASKYGLGEEVLDKIQYARSMSMDHLEQLLQQAEQIMQEREVKLMVVDSLRSLLAMPQGRGELSQRAYVLSRLLRTIHRLAEEFDVAVVMTTQTIPRNDVLVGGRILRWVAGACLELKKQENGKRSCDVSFMDVENQRIAFKITDAGLEDEDEQAEHGR